MVILNIGLIISIILVGGLLVRKSLKESDKNKNKVIADVIRGDTDILYLKSQNSEKQFEVCYRDKLKGFQREIIMATNPSEAEAKFCKENGIPPLRILSVEVRK